MKDKELGGRSKGLLSCVVRITVERGVHTTSLSRSGPEENAAVAT